jgi:hypothetical protein
VRIIKLSCGELHEKIKGGRRKEEREREGTKK